MKTKHYYNIMIDLIINIKNFLVNILRGLAEGFKASIQSAKSLPNQIKIIRFKFENLEETNFETANYHLMQGNLNDAIFRLKILSRFISPNNPKALYKLAWCYFIKEDFASALEHLKQCSDLDSFGLLKYLSNSNPDKIPDEILQEYKNLTPYQHSRKFITKSINLHNTIVELMIKCLKIIPNKSQILDLGCGVGLNGEAIHNLIPQGYILTGVEDSKVLLDKVQQTRCYDSTYNAPLDIFLTSTTTKYDIILSLNSLSLSKDLSFKFNNIKNILKEEGFFISAFRVDETSKLSNNKVEFLYEPETLKQEILRSKFKIIELKEVKLSPSCIYLLTVCKIITDKEH